ncbi:MAG TPA: trypsin-like serine protease [Vicinamibacterales bacterium]
MARSNRGCRGAYQLAAALLTCAALVVLMSPSAAAIVIRHDKADADALRLGAKFEAVGRVLPDGGCTLIAPTWVATAAHVAASVSPGGRVQFGDRTYAVKRTVIHPDGTGPAGQPPEVDLALLELAEPVASVAPIEPYRQRNEMGQSIFIVGYGDFGNPRIGLKRGDGRRRAVTNLVDDAGPRRIFMRFDEPPKGTEFEGVGGPGDSGGPALLGAGGRYYLAGVSSASMDGKPGQYGITDVYTRVSSFVSWIDSITHPSSAAR